MIFSADGGCEQAGVSVRPHALEQDRDNRCYIKLYQIMTNNKAKRCYCCIFQSQNYRPAFIPKCSR